MERMQMNDDGGVWKMPSRRNTGVWLLYNILTTGMITLLYQM